MDGNRDQAVGPRRTRLLLAAGGALLALAGHLELIRRFGTVLPYRDQWKATGQDILGRWVEGDLRLEHFFERLNDHWPVLTRMLSFVLAGLNGQWNNLVEVVVNAALHAGAVFIFLLAALPALGRRAGTGFALLTGLVLALPFRWENALWGIQSLVYLQILLSLAFLAAVATAGRFDARWWLGQSAGLLVLLTQHSGVLVHAAAVPLFLWQVFRRDNRRLAGAGLAISITILVVFVTCMPPLTVTAALRADSWMVALDVMLRQLAWPVPHPAAAFLIYLPWLAFAADRAGRRHLPAADRFIIVAGLWVGAQALAIGYGRGADTIGFVSRYTDFLAFGFLLNAACLVRFWTVSRRGPRALLVALAAAWFVVAAQGLWAESTGGHADYNLSRRPQVNQHNLQAVRGFVETGDADYLSHAKVGDTLYTHPPAVQELLANPRFRALLPPETGAREARADHGRFGGALTLLPKAAWLVALLGAGCVLGGWRLRSCDLSLTRDPGPSTWTLARGWSALGAVVLASLIALALWPLPLTFDRTTRWALAYAPPVPGVEYPDLELRVEGGRYHISPRAALGAVATTPAEMRSHWYGTRFAPDADFQGVLHSTPFPLEARYLFVPVTGWPSWPGNGLRWRFINPEDGAERWISYVEPNPVDSVGMWAVDAGEFKGWEAAIHLFDGGTDERGWLGIARPAVSDRADFGGEWIARIHAERAEPTHRTIAVLALAAAVVWLAAGAWMARSGVISLWKRGGQSSS